MILGGVACHKCPACQAPRLKPSATKLIWAMDQLLPNDSFVQGVQQATWVRMNETVAAKHLNVSSRAETCRHQGRVRTVSAARPKLERLCMHSTTHTIAPRRCQ